MFILQLSLMTTLLYKRSKVLKEHETNIPGGVKKLAGRFWKQMEKEKQIDKTKFLVFFLLLLFCLVGGKKGGDNKENSKNEMLMKRKEICIWSIELAVIVLIFFYFQIIQHLEDIGVWVSCVVFIFSVSPQTLVKRQTKSLIHWLISRDV